MCLYRRRMRERKRMNERFLADDRIFLSKVVWPNNADQMAARVNCSRRFLCLVSLSHSLSLSFCCVDVFKTIAISLMCSRWLLLFGVANKNPEHRLSGLDTMWLETAIQWRKSAKNYIINGNHICKWNWTICNITSLHILKALNWTERRMNLHTISVCESKAYCVCNANNEPIEESSNSQWLNYSANWFVFSSSLVSLPRRDADDCYLCINC